MASGMSSGTTGADFSNADTGSKTADPYKAKNLDTDASVKEKVEDLGNFIDGCKFGMMTTRQDKTGHLVSRCMALAGRVSFYPFRSFTLTACFVHGHGTLVLRGLSSNQENGVDLVFTTNTESGKTDELLHDPNINISFLNNSGEWASVSGETTIQTDRETIKKWYSRALKAWIGDLGDGVHDGGPDGKPLQ